MLRHPGSFYFPKTLGRSLLPRVILIYSLAILHSTQISDTRCVRLPRGYARRSSIPLPVRHSPSSSTINKLILYVVTGTCEFIVDNQTGAYFFLELNARLQVEHTITEAVHSEHGLDLVELMIGQGVAEFEARALGMNSCIFLSMQPPSRSKLHRPSRSLCPSNKYD